MARVLILVPTTGGPLIIRKLSPRPALPASCAFADGDFRPLPWSADYARLAGPDGPLARHLPEADRVPHELRMSGSFDAGRSWELPVVLAHLALAGGDTLTDDPAQAERILFATGAVDLDLKVIPGDYALEAKLRQCEAVFRANPQAGIDIRLPPGSDIDAALAMAIKLCGEQGMARVVDSAVASAALPRQQANSSGVPKPLIFAGGALVLAATAMTMGYALLPPSVPAPVPQPVAEKIATPVQPQEPPKETPVPLVVEELRTPQGATCRQVVFGAAQPVSQIIALDKTTLSPSRADPGLCGLRFKVSPAGKVQYTLPAELLAATLAPVAGADGMQTLMFKQNLTQNIVYRVQISGEGLPAGLALTHEIRIAAP
jgi:hypothetical protein